MKKVFAVAIAAALTLAACGSDDEASEDTVAEDTVAEEVVADGDIVAVASGNPDFSTLVVPTRIGWPNSWRSTISAITASYFAFSVR